MNLVTSSFVIGETWLYPGYTNSISNFLKIKILFRFVEAEKNFLYAGLLSK